MFLKTAYNQVLGNDMFNYVSVVLEDWVICGSMSCLHVLGSNKNKSNMKANNT